MIKMAGLTTGKPLGINNLLKLESSFNGAKKSLLNIDNSALIGDALISLVALHEDYKKDNNYTAANQIKKLINKIEVRLNLNDVISELQDIYLKRGQ